MKRNRGLLITLIVAGIMLAAWGLSAASLIYFYPASVSTTQTNIPLPGYSEWVMISNDGSTRVYLLFGQGTVDTTAGAGGGYLEASETYTFHVRTNHVGMKTASSTSTARLWAAYK